MPLHIGAGNAKRFFKYSAKSDKWFVRGEDGQDKEIERPTFAADLANIKTGWVRFREGQPPEWVMDPSLQQEATRPGDDFRRGFVLQAFSPRYFGGLAELATSGIHVCNAVKDVYEQFLKEKDGHPGKVPLLTCSASRPMKDRHGTNYRPIIAIINWVERPAELPDGSSTGSPPTQPPPPTPPPEPRRTDPSSDEPLF